MLRHPAAAVAAMIAVLFILPAIAQALPDSWRNPVTESPRVLVRHAPATAGMTAQARMTSTAVTAGIG